MILSLLILAIVAGVAFFHYVQGFFSAFLSLVITVIAATLAMGLHEYLVVNFAGGRLADQSSGVVICVLFAVTYIALRTAFDQMVPGNVNFGSLPNKIGAGACGVLAGLFAGGVVAVATQSLPFGPSVGWHARFESLGDTKVQLNTVPDWSRVGREDITDLLVKYDELKHPRIVATSENPALDLWVAADNFLLGFISMVSDGGLAGDVKWSEVHPDLTTQYFGQRIGLQPGAKRTAFPLNGKSALDIAGVYLAPKGGFPQIDGELKEYRASGFEQPQKQLMPGENQTLVVVRAVIDGSAADADGKIRLSLGSMRLVAGGRNFFPVAYLTDKVGEDGLIAVHHKADDFLVLDGGGKGLDLVFSVDTELLLGKDVSADAAELKVAPRVFAEFKRFSRFDLGAKELKAADTYETDARTAFGPLRRQGWPESAKK